MIAKSRRRPKLHNAMCKCVKIANSRFVQASKDLECDRPAWTKLDQIDSYDWPAWTNLDWLVSNCVFPLHSCMMSARLAQEGSAAYCGGVRALQYRNWIRTCAYVHNCNVVHTKPSCAKNCPSFKSAKRAPYTYTY